MPSDKMRIYSDYIAPWLGDLFDWEYALLNWIVLVLLQIVLLWGVAIYLARRHERSLSEREAAMGRPLLSTLKTAPEGYGDPALVIGNVVLGHAKVRGLTILWRRIVGGRIGLLEKLLERGRREAVQRLIDEAEARGASLVINIRFQSHAIGVGDNGAMGVEILASGTALRLRAP